MKVEAPLNRAQITEILADKSLIISEDTKRENRTPPEQHEVKK